MIKKKWLLILLFLLLFQIKDVKAFSIGVCNEEHYDGVFFMGDENNFTTRANAETALVVSYDDEDIGKITVNISLDSGMSILSTSIYEGNGTITGTSPNYTINIPNNEEANGTAVFQIILPSPSQTKDVTLNATATSYNKSGSQIETQTTKSKYLILVKDTNCNNSSTPTITTSAGTPNKIGEIFGSNYLLETTESTIDINFTKENNKQKIYYTPDGLFSENQTLLSNNSLKGQKLEVGDNEFDFLIESECYSNWKTIIPSVDGRFLLGIDLADYQESPNVYTLTVKRIDNRSKINTLSSLSITNTTINFNSNLKTYIANVPNNITSVKITSTLTDSKSTYAKGYGNRTVNLDEGTNDVLIKVIAENGDEAVYTIKITREVSDNANLKKLSINNKEITLKKDTLIYSTIVSNDITKVDIIAEPENPNSKVEIQNIDELKEGKNKVNITVTSPNGKKNIYVITITRDKLISENAYLESIKIKNHKISFQRDQLEYSIKKEKNEEKLDITVKTENDKASYIIIGNKNLKNGSIVKIKVTAQDNKTTKTYLIHIKDKSFNILWLIIGILIIGIGVGIYYFIIKKKSKKETTTKSIEELNTSSNENILAAEEQNKLTTNDNTINNNNNIIEEPKEYIIDENTKNIEVLNDTTSEYKPFSESKKIEIDNNNEQK